MDAEDNGWRHSDRHNTRGADDGKGDWSGLAAQRAWTTTLHGNFRGNRAGHTRAVLSGADDTHGRELWATDGRLARLVKDIAPGSDSSDPDELTTAGKTVFFTADDGVHGRELWKTDGSSAGTRLVKDIQPSGASSAPGDLTAVGHRLFFRADDGTHGSELWTSDGTAAGMRMVTDIRSGGASAFPAELTAVGRDVYFRANDGVHGVALWKSDGTSGGTTLVKDFIPGSFDPPTPYSQAPEHLTAVGNELFLTSRQGGFNIGLWKTDGTPEGTVLLKNDLIDNPHSGFITNLEAAGKTLFFNTGFALWKSDGTPEGTQKVKSFASIPETNPNNLTAVGNDLFFTANDGVHGRELWFSDGTTDGTHLVKDITPGSGSSAVSNLTALGQELFFTAGVDHGPLDLWMSDGTAAGTHRVKDVASNDGWSSPADLSVVDNRLFFSATDLQQNRVLFAVDAGGSNVTRIGSADPAFPSFDPRSVTPV